MKKFFSLLFLMMFFSSFDAVAMTDKKVFFVLWNGCEDACHGFQDYLKSEGFEGEIIKRDLKKSTKKIPEVIAEIKKVSPDLIVTWGTMASLKVLGDSKNNPSPFAEEIPAVFMVVSQPVKSGLVPSRVLQGRNITGITHLVPLSEQLQYARQILNYKRLGVVYNPLESNALLSVEELRKYASLMRFDLIEKPLPLLNNQPDATKISAFVKDLAEQQVDMIYLPPDAFVNQHRDILTKSATDFFIPVFSASEGAVLKSDALFSFVHRYYNIGQMAGKKAVEILKDNVPAYDIAIESPQRALLVVNMKVAEKIGVFPPLNLLSSADLVNLPKAE